MIYLLVVVVGFSAFAIHESLASCYDPVHDKYRTYDGTCNNRQNELYGSMNSELRRLVDPAYDYYGTDDYDFESKRSLETNGNNELPSTRLVSLRVHKTTPVDDEDHTHSIMQWGQYLSHDTSLTPTFTKDIYGNTLDCSKCPTPSEPIDVNRCCPISIPKEENILDENLICLFFARSKPSTTSGTRNQQNVVTSYVDASTVYGSSKVEADGLREFKFGRMETMKVFHPKPQIFMPQSDLERDACKKTDVKTDQPCFHAGEKRNSETAALASYHTLWVRAHNAIAARLRTINKKWDDEKLYQEARKIVGALHQHIQYGEYLPVVLGDDIMEQYGLKIDGVGRSQYDPKILPDISNACATAAFRFGHSQIRNKFTVGNSTVNTADIFFTPDMLYKTSENMDLVVKGLLTDKAQKSDCFFATAVRNLLFLNFDLPAVNIQRGRDHGLPSYPNYREFFNLSVPNNFVQLKTVVGMDEEVAESLKSVYKDVDDIDLFAGAMCEPAVDGGIVGAVNAHILGEQFHKLRYGDRFFYTHEESPAGFTDEQLSSIKNVRFSHLMCELFMLDYVQGEVFKVAGEDNPLQRCSDIEPMNLQPWKEE